MLMYKMSVIRKFRSWQLNVLESFISIWKLFISYWNEKNLSHFGHKCQLKKSLWCARSHPCSPSRVVPLQNSSAGLRTMARLGRVCRTPHPLSPLQIDQQRYLAMDPALEEASAGRLAVVQAGRSLFSWWRMASTIGWCSLANLG